ncbi:hypothetical protein HaLaN_14689 [Haematococcus lacustris]|uniref:Uncharacterized protein n=1 Tax=Haematococcus lacustris TaxID=44745 RepID=A0A699Z755_HAELA|nr:hypothetical protein HaLaN_14689 [Haematococcus lacustris]
MSDLTHCPIHVSRGLVAQGTLPVAPGGGGAAGGKEWIANPVLPQDILQELSLTPTQLEAISALTCLEWLCLALDESDEPFSTLLPVLAQMPSLHTLILKGRDVEGDDQLDALLAATQLTYLQVHSFSDLTLSKATLGESEEIGVEELAAAELNLCERNTAGLVVARMEIDKDIVDLLTEQYLSHRRHGGQKPLHPTGPSSSHSAPTTSWRLTLCSKNSLLSFAAASQPQ